tara:strand:+ start:161 stop:760 length:600 start_codon:yes stop_codon:yes gene_type:complete
MSFAINKNGNSSSDWPKGVYINRIQVTNVDNSDNKFDYDISVRVEGTMPDNPSLKYPTSFYINGVHAKDKGVAVDFGSPNSTPPVSNGSWKLRHFLEELGIENKTPLTNDFSGINDDCIQDCIGRSVYILQYETTKLNKKGNPKRKTWFYYASEDKGMKYLLNKWTTQKNLPKNYKSSPSEKIANMWDNKPTGDDTPNL